MKKVLREEEMVPMENATRSWHPSEAEVERMVAEMRPLIAELARQARRDCQSGRSLRECRAERR